MDNFQLYRTNVFLGGQLKWDLIVDNSSTRLHVADFHLSPISDNIPFIYKTDDVLIYNTHQDNVKAYYNANKGNFYKEGLDPKFTHNWPIIDIDNKADTLYSNIFDMGCRRSKRFKTYGKQFELFCPVWLEHLTDDLSFKINIRSMSADTVIASNVLRLSMNGNDFHDKFVKYFNNYIKYSKLDTGNDDLINIQFNNYATVKGLDVSTGIMQTKSVDNLINNFTLCERPLMETDNMIIQSFVNNSIICNQLFNFNLCFNVDDILSGSITQLMHGENIRVSVDVFVGDQQLQKMDFYTNYDHIDKKIWSDKRTDFSDNVLNYLHDNESIELINKNKFGQNICHWSLNENADYIFNVYDGFSGLYIEEDSYGNNVIYENAHQHENAPNVFIKKADKNQNSAGWVNNIEIKKWNAFYKYISNTAKYKLNGTYIYDNKYINNIKYNYVPKVDSCAFDSQKGFYVISMSMSNKLLVSIVDAFKCIDIYNQSVYVLCKDDLMMILSDDINNLTYMTFYNILYNFMNSIDLYEGMINDISKRYITELYHMLHSKIDPKIITFTDSIVFTNAVGPASNTTEVTYYKDSRPSHNYIMRYDGTIKPSFTNDRNILYYKDCVDRTLKNCPYVIYNTGQEPLFPSIGYCAIKKITDWSYNDLPSVKTTEFDDAVSIYDQTYEYSWFNNSKCMILDDEMHFTYVNRRQPDGTYKSIDTVINECIATYYSLDDDALIAYVRGKYECTNDWEYYSNTNITDYRYSITLKLK